MTGEMNHDVFISFSFKDINKAMQVVNELLSRHGIRCWICTKEIDGGSSYKQDIVNAIMASKLTVLLWSKNAAASLDIPREIGIALEERKYVIPFLLDTTPFTPSLRYDLTGVQQTKGYGKSFSDCIADLADDIAKKLKGTNRTAPQQTGQQPAAVPAESKLAPMAPAIQETQPATQPDVQKIITYELRHGGYTVTGVPDIETVVIPESVKGLPVVAIGKNAFKGRDKVKYVKLPASLRWLEYWAFSDCYGLRELEIPEGVTEIGKW
ncbi:MAG: TIR domain-containing protein, partial [Clostridia bacterium]|nr:TIR domain-containing protein [Clostridia bacterium]